MSVLPDPHELRAVADRIAAHATAVRREATQLAIRRDALVWHGMAADAFRGAADQIPRSSRDCADRLDSAAAALRQHADAVEHSLAVLRRVQAEMVHGAADVVELVQSGAADIDDVVHNVGQGVTYDVTHPLDIFKGVL